MVTFDLATKSKHILAPEITNDSAFAVAPDGRSIYVLSEHRKGDIWLVSEH